MISFFSTDNKKNEPKIEPIAVKIDMLKPQNFILVPEHILRVKIQKVGVESIGISAKEYESLFINAGAENFVAINERVYHVISMKWLKEGELAAKHKDLEYFKKISGNFEQVRLGIFPVAINQHEISRAIIQVSSATHIGCLESSKLFKKALLGSLKDEVMYSNSEKTITIEGNKYFVKIKSLMNSDLGEQPFGLFAFNTKIRLLFNDNRKFFFNNRLCDNNRVSPQFFFTVKAISSQVKVSSDELHFHFSQEYLKEKAPVIFLGNKVSVTINKNSLFVRLKKVAVKSGFYTLNFDAKTYKNRTQCFRICQGSNISFLIPDGLNKELDPIKDDKRKDNLSMGNKIEGGNQPGNQSSIDQKTISFREFLTNEGIVGLPDQLEETINPILAAFGCLKPIMTRRGIKPEKGIILYGPPGTGKTTFARKLAQYIKCPAEQISLVSATELIGGVVGETEKNIRKLFEPAREAAKKLGQESPLFVIVIDEIESLCRTRNMAKSSWETTQVNQFLTEMDGLNQISNLLVIGMTNNIDLIDEALLRSGRFGTKVMIAKPNNLQRKKILDVYLKPLRDKNLFSSDVETGIEQIVNLIDGYTGADIKGLVDKVNNNAFARVEKLFQEGKVALEEVERHPDGRVTLQDFRSAVKEYSLNPRYNK